MKQLMVRPMGRLVILVILVFSQVVFAEAPIQPDDSTTTTTRTRVSKSSPVIESPMYSNYITIDIVGSDLIISFDAPIGIATVSIKDKKGKIVYITTVDTENIPDVNLPKNLFSTGTYTVAVSYDSLVYTEQVQF